MLELLERIRNGKNVRVAALADAIGMSRGGLYGAIDAGDVEAVKIGRAVLVPAHVARKLLGMQPESLAA
ncbi:excisionase [Methylobacterium sp. WL8]|nr:excisionase [Methylobacterium sp. WL8]